MEAERGWGFHFGVVVMSLYHVSCMGFGALFEAMKVNSRKLGSNAERRCHSSATFLQGTSEVSPPLLPRINSTESKIEQGGSKQYCICSIPTKVALLPNPWKQTKTPVSCFKTSHKSRDMQVAVVRHGDNDIVKKPKVCCLLCLPSRTFRFQPTHDKDGIT